jgi:formylglycine-generating enzyme required for sulfatase activity
MNSRTPRYGEGPVREVTVSPFRMDVHTVTNAEFTVFVEETGHQTDAEQFGWSSGTGHRTFTARASRDWP